MEELSRPKVLVVDDDATIRELCAAMLGSSGYDVLQAANGQDALDLALTAAPDVVLLDISLPVLDGFGVAAALRADERTRGLPVVFITGEDDPSVTERVYETGAAGFFRKPFDPGAVAALVRVVISNASGGHAF